MMTFSYTDEQLNNLNRDYAVYSVNLEFAKRNGRTYVNSNLIENISPDDLEKTNTITTSDGQEFRVVATKSDPVTGFDVWCSICDNWLDFLYSTVIYL